MKSYQELQSIVDRTVVWERKLNDLYDVAAYGLKSDASKEALSFLAERQEANLEILEHLDVSIYGPTEWVKFPPEIEEEELIPKHSFSKESSPKEILTAILTYEAKLRDFYRGIFDKLVGEDQKVLFDSLARFREEQIGRIENFMKVHAD